MFKTVEPQFKYFSFEDYYEYEELIYTGDALVKSELVPQLEIKVSDILVLS
jgi:hypothetical protein